MATLKITRFIDAPLADVWASWEDFGNVYKFHPGLRHSQLMTDSDQPTGVGTERQCDLADGKNWVRERITEYRPKQSIAIDAYESSMPVKSLAARVGFREVSASRTMVSMVVDFEPGMGILGKLMVPLMKRQFKGMLEQMLACNAAHVIDGEVVPAAA